ncbi:hypothetical protein JCGZ_09609 [Jatropha curcas]|uniref:Uncharacterized protein n=1 Tax=Jatropha curcas TaxID=180498 RepID=A0A067LKX0_JATCU|nr:hypothetical protein JCGZ_09609 [Jatropha curcas]
MSYIDLGVKRVWPDTREHKAKATNARKDNTTEDLAIPGNLSLPQFDSQSSTRKTADVDADKRRYVKTYNIKHKAQSFTLVIRTIKWEVKVITVQVHLVVSPGGSMADSRFQQDN